MELIKLDQLTRDSSPVVITLGAFDGIHYGHQHLIKRVITTADQLDYRSVLFSFTSHPLSVIDAQQSPPLITNWQQRSQILNRLGLDRVYLAEFTTDFAQLEFRDFVEQYLVEQINVQRVIIGEDFRFGYRGLGTADKLKELGAEFGFEVEIVSPITIDGQIVSSTYIRSLIREGKVAQVKKFLTRNYSLIGEVVKGYQRGRKLGFPTANLDPIIDYVIPKSGIYAVYVYLAGEKYLGVAHLGSRPTFAKQEFSIEVNIFDFDADIYHQQLEVEFVKRLRDKVKFDNQEALVDQIEKDVAAAREVLESNK
ncbi:MAG: bifunctional riboflavin kinase/FAD synthetase [Bacillota bacterium]